MKRTFKLLLLMIILLTATLVPNTASAEGCGSTFWGMMHGDCDPDLSDCNCANDGRTTVCDGGNTKYVVDCSAGSSCTCAVIYET